MDNMHKKTLKIIALIIIMGVPLLVGVGGYSSSDTATKSTSSPSGFFPIGLYAVNSFSPYSNDVTREFPDISAAGFNLIQSYQFEGDIEGDNAGSANTNEDARAYLDAAHKSGLKVLMGIPQQCVLEGNLAYIRERVLALKDHPALFGWQLYDEPDVPGYDLQGKEQAPPLPPENLIAAYKAIKELDPTHPVSIASFLEIDEKYPYLNGFDIFLGDYMNIPVESPTANIAPYVPSAARVLTPLGKSVMPTIQVYNVAKDALITSSGETEDGREIISQGRYPTREEIRFMAYYAILRGAKGVFFNCYRFDYGEEIPGDDISRKANPSQWKAVSSVASELKSMTPILLAPTQEPEKAGVAIAGGSIVEMMVKQHQEKTYLFAVNPSPDPVYIQFILNQFPNPKITLLPEGQRIPFKSESGTFNVQFSPYEVCIYEIASGEAVSL